MQSSSPRLVHSCMSLLGKRGTGHHQAQCSQDCTGSLSSGRFLAQTDSMPGS
jgi:hypothetical protein